MTDGTPWVEVDRYHWRHITGRYFVERSLVLGTWVYLGWHKPKKPHGAKDDPIAVCVSPIRRFDFRSAADDCAAHHQQQQQQRRAAA